VFKKVCYFCPIVASFGTRTALFWVVTQRVVVIPCRCFGTTYRSHLQGSAQFSSTSWRKP